ncbi:MAG: aminoacyl-tRNA hydrolase [Candidatus Gracilibacteria bacterium]|nr:aminoacyl-tRNA hydrolase [Candidatus Gracilibacteria bacterium]
MKLLIGLGNPGDKYLKTRHNIGFRVIDAFLKPFDGESTSCSKFNAEVTELTTPDSKLLVIKPMTFMNLSGESAQQFVNFYKLNPEEDILICYDDKDLMFGTLRERSEGGSGGHNGIKSLSSHLGTQKYHRLKFGVGHEDQKIPTDAFVLQKFNKEEEEQLPVLIGQAVKKIEEWLK